MLIVSLKFHYEGLWSVYINNTRDVYTVITDEELNAALIGSTVGVAAFLVIAEIVLFSILFGVCTYRKKEKMAMHVVDDTEGGN